MFQKLQAVLAVTRVVRRAVGPQFRETLALASREVRMRDLHDVPGEVKRTQALAALKTATRDRGMDVQDWALSLALEVAVAALKAGFDKLFGRIPPTVRMVGVLLLLAGTAQAACIDRANTSCNPSQGKDCCADLGLACLGSDKLPIPAGSTKGGSCKPWGGTTSSTTTTRPPPTTTSTTLPGVTTTTVTPTTRPPTTTVPPTTTTTLPPVLGACRPNGIDVSVRWGKQNAAKWFPRSSPNVRWASQQERDCMEQARLELDNQLSWTIGHLCPEAAECVDGLRTLAYTRIEVRTPYRGTTYDPKGAVWIHGPQGRLYQEPGQCGAEFRQCVLKRARAQAVTALASAPNLRNYLDVNATLTGPAEFPTYPVPKRDPTKRANAHPVDTRKRFPPCGGGNGCVDLHTTHLAHACTTARLRGLPPPTDCTADVPSPSVAHVRYENGCGADEDCHWFRRMHFFDGFQDRASASNPNGWSDAELDVIFRLEDRVHGEACWMGAQARGDAPESERCAKQHDELHQMRNRATGWLAVYPWPGVSPFQFLQHQGNRVLPPKELLPMIAKAYAIK